MKQNIHPKWYPDAKVICNGQVVLVTGSTVPEMHVEVWSGNHPFYTGKQLLLDTTGHVDRFKKRTVLGTQKRAEVAAKPKKVRKARGSSK